MTVRPSRIREGTAEKHGAIWDGKGTNFTCFSAHATRETIVSHPRWRDVHALPVTDDAGRLLGAIRYGTFRRLEEEDAIERRHHHPTALVMSFVRLYWLAIVELLPVFGDLFMRLIAAPMRRARAGQRSRA